MTQNSLDLGPEGRPAALPVARDLAYQFAMTNGDRCAGVDVARELVARGYAPQVDCAGGELFAPDKWQFVGEWRTGKQKLQDHAHRIYQYIGPRPGLPGRVDRRPPPGASTRATPTADSAPGMAPDVARWCNILRPLSLADRRDMWRQASPDGREKMKAALQALGVDFKKGAIK